MVQMNTASDISSFVSTIFEDTLTVARDNNLLTALVTVFNDRTGVAVRKNQTYGTATVNTIAETDDLASQAFLPTALSTLTPAEAGAQFFLTDTRIETDPFGVRQDAAIELGSAMGQKIERDIISDFPSLTGGTVGAAGTAMAWNYFFAMMAQLRIQNAPMPWAFVCTPAQWHQLGKSVAPGATVTNAPAFQDEVLRRWYVQTVGGVDIYVTTNSVPDSSDDAYCAMFNRQALALDIRRAPRIEPERDASRRGWELNLSTVYAHGVWRPKFGVKGTFDSATPTS